MKIKLGLGGMMMSSVAEFCEGRLFGADRGFEYICTDSREADENTLFVATRGERVDGHNYIKNAKEAGCRTFVCEYIPEGTENDASFCLMQNSLDAFFMLARGYRAGGGIFTVAITGSVGKTTTKELTSLVLEGGRNLYHTKGNFNSVIGMPMSLMEAPANTDTAVFEMGMSGPYEIHRMSLAASPKIALITNIGSSHLEYLKTRENIALAKYEIADGLCDGGILILNGDEPLLRELAGKNSSAKYKVMYVTLKGDGDFKISNIRYTQEGSIFDLEYDGGILKDAFVSARGEHIAIDAAFAAAVGLLVGQSEHNIREGLSRYVPSQYRQKIYTHNGITIISDCYNAAPESVKSALSVLASLDNTRKIAVLGNMKELGGESEKMHFSVGEAVSAYGIDILLAVGALAHHIYDGATASGMSRENAFAFDTKEEAVEKLKEMLKMGDAVLFKASRSEKFEDIIEKLTE